MLLNCGVGEDSWESLELQGNETSQSQRKSILNIHWKDWCWSWTSVLWPPDAKNRLSGKDPDAGKDWRRKEKGMTEDEMVGWHHQFNRYEFEQTLWDDEGQGGLASCSPWSCKESDLTESLSSNKGLSARSEVWGPQSIQMQGMLSWAESSKGQRREHSERRRFLKIRE